MINCIDLLEELVVIFQLLFILRGQKGVYLFKFDLPAAVQAPGGACHQLHKVIVALSLLDLPHHVLYVSKPVSLRKLHQHFPFLFALCRFCP